MFIKMTFSNAFWSRQNMSFISYQKHQSVLANKALIKLIEMFIKMTFSDAFRSL